MWATCHSEVSISSKRFDPAFNLHILVKVKGGIVTNRNATPKELFRSDAIDDKREPLVAVRNTEISRPHQPPTIPLYSR